MSMQKQIEELQRERQRAIESKIVIEDEQKILRGKIEEYKKLENNLRENIEE